MPDTPDAAPTVTIAPSPRRWSFPGGEESDEGVTLYLVTFTPGGDERRWRIPVAIHVRDDGTPLIEKVFAEEERP